MAAKIHRAVLLLAVAVSLIQARRRPVHVVSGTIQNERRQSQQDAYADPWMTDSTGHWGSPEGDHPPVLWGAEETNFWDPEPSSHWGSDPDDYWKPEPQNQRESDTNDYWGPEANSHLGEDFNNFWETDANHPMGDFWGDATSNHWPGEEPISWGTETNMWGDQTSNHWGDNREHLGAPQDNLWGSSHEDAWKETADSTDDYPNYPDGFFDQYPPYTESSFGDYPDYSDYGNDPQNPYDYYDYYKEYDNYPEYFKLDYDDYPTYSEASKDDTDYTRDFPEYSEPSFDYLGDPENPFNEYSDYPDYPDYQDYPFDDYPDRGNQFGDYRDQVFFGNRNPNSDIQLIGGSSTTALEDLFSAIARFDSGRIPQVLKNLASGFPLSSASDPSPVVGVQDFSEVADTFNVAADMGIANAEEGPRGMPEMPTMPTEGGGGGGGGSEDEMTDMMMKHLGFDVTNPFEVDEGELFQMDILMTKPQMDEVMSDMKLDVTPKKGISDSRFLWPAGPDGFPLVPYTFGDDKVKRGICKQAMNEWETHSCIKFEELEGSSKEPHLNFEQREGCYSYIGRIWFFEGQVVSIGKYCDLFSAVHEVGHALGLFHEQSRADRDEYIHVNTDNIQTSRKHNFEKAKFEFVENHGVQYDYTSIMHYKGKTYYNGGHSLSTINPLYQELLASMDRLSFRDKLLINRMYSCIDKWLTICELSSDPCQNNGYTGADCRCVCPPGTSGELCQTVTGDYYEMYMSGCSETLTEETVVESENYPNNVPEGVRCTKLIVPPECHSVELMFYNFGMYPRIRCQNSKECCYWDGLEIRTSDPYNGDWYCGREITPGQKFTSNGNLTLYYHAVSAYSRGFRARLSFPAIEGCQIEGRTGSKKANPGTTLTHLKKMTIVNRNTVVSDFLPSKSSRVCGIQNEFGNLHWNSPAFGSGKYPTDFSCGFTIVPKIPAPLSVHFDFFELQPRFKKLCVDSVSISEPFGVQKRFCGSEASSFVLPSSSLTAIFTSDEKYTYEGFNITLEQRTSPCHKILRAGIAGGRITTPGYPRYHGEERNCEWWIIAPENRRVKISVSGKSIRECRRNYLVVDMKGSRTYKKDSSKRYCGENNLPFTLVSSGNEIDILYKSSINSKGFEIVYGVV